MTTEPPDIDHARRCIVALALEVPASVHEHCSKVLHPLLDELVRLRADIARWEALGERHNIKPREPGCKCTYEEGDSSCPIHPTCDVCGTSIDELGAVCPHCRVESP